MDEIRATHAANVGSAEEKQPSYFNRLAQIKTKIIAVWLSAALGWLL